MDTAYIPISTNEFAVVDLEDVPTILDIRKWRKVDHGYACGTKNSRPVYMHRLVCPGQGEVDHINKDKLDNRKSNLRLTTRQQNALNGSRRSESEFVGVTLKKGRWQAYMVVDSQYIYIGNFSKPEAAARARDTAMREWAGVCAIYNFKEVNCG